MGLTWETSQTKTDTHLPSSYFGRSTGAGGLAIWTHNLKDTTVLDWSDANYTGKALRMGAGVQGFDAAEAAAAADLSMCCSTRLAL